MNETPSKALAIPTRGYSAGDSIKPCPSNVTTPRLTRSLRTSSEGRLRFLPRLALLLSLTSTTLEQENQRLGRMWTLKNPPLAYLGNEHASKPNQDWLNSA